MRAAIRTTVRIGNQECGQGLVLFVAGLAGFCAIVGMSVDIGSLVYTRTDLQKIADASALAAVQDLPGSTANATTTANSYATSNGIATISLAFSTTNVANDTITVTATRHIDYKFLGIIGMSGADVTASAKAMGTTGAAITGYTWADIAEFTIWGGSRQSEVHSGDSMCTLHVCTGKSYTFLDTNWMNHQGYPIAPDWTASGSNNYKGDLNHSNQAQVSQIGDTFSDGGLGSVVTPNVGDILVIPIISKATGNSNLRNFTIGAWAIVKVDSGCTKNGCTGTIQGTTIVPPAGYSTSGSVQPPSGLTYKAPVTSTLLQ